MSERASPELFQGGLTLSFSVDAAVGESEFYWVAVRDKNGAAVITAQLPRGLVDKVVLAQTSVTFALTLSGNVYVELDVIEDQAMAHTPIDQLVEQAVEPRMLEDEPHAAELLHTLRQKLMAAVSTVDTALASVSKR